MDSFDNNFREQPFSDLTSLDEQVRQCLDEVLVQKTEKLIGKDIFERIKQAWIKENLVSSHYVEQILDEMKIMGIKTDNELVKLVKSVTPVEARDAFDAYKEALKEGRVQHHEKFLKAAIANKYVPNYRKKINF